MANILNCADVPVDEAYAYALAQCDAENKELSDYFSAFKNNYQMLQDKCDLALDLPRIEMPVIEPEHMDDFQESIESGEIDVAEPLSNIDSKYPTDLKFDVRGRSWLVKGLRDGSDTDDVLDVEKTEIAVRDLKPSQSQIWLEKVVGMSLYFGPLTQSSDFLYEAPIIVSSDGYILDGHHRFGAAMVSNPSLRLLALKVDMPIRELVKMARSYGNAIGNEQKAAETFNAESGEPIYVVKRDYTGAETDYLIGTESYILKEMGVAIDVTAYELDIDYEDMTLEEIFDSVFEYGDEYDPELIGKFTDGMYLSLKSYDGDKDVGVLQMFDGETIDYTFDLSELGFKHESNAESFNAETFEAYNPPLEEITASCDNCGKSFPAKVGRGTGQADSRVYFGNGKEIGWTSRNTRTGEPILSCEECWETMSTYEWNPSPSLFDAETFESDEGIQVAKGYDEWWDELDSIRSQYPPDKFFNRRLGNPKWEDVILEQLFKDGWTPKEALFSWKYYNGSPHHFSRRPQAVKMRGYEKNLNQATTKKCKNCGEKGHTARSCKNERVRESRYANDKETRLKLSRKLTAISKTGQSHKYTIDDMNYALGALVAGREWNHDSQHIGVTIALSEHPSARLVEKNWNDIQDMRDDLGVDDFKKMVDSTKWSIGEDNWKTYMAETESKTNAYSIFGVSFVAGLIASIIRKR